MHANYPPAAALKGSELKIHTEKGKIHNLKEKGNNNDDNRIEILLIEAGKSVV